MEKVILKNNDQTKEYDVLFTFRYNGEKYVTYTNYEKNENGNLICYSSVERNQKLVPITDEKALDIINEMLKTLTNSTKQKFQNK